MSQTIQKIRLKNFLKILGEGRFDKDMGAKLEWSPAYISQIKKGTKALGSVNARKIERAFKLQEGFMDVSHEQEFRQRRASDTQLPALALAIQQLPPHISDEMTRLAFVIAAEMSAHNVPEPPQFPNVQDEAVDD